MKNGWYYLQLKALEKLLDEIDNCKNDFIAIIENDYLFDIFCEQLELIILRLKKELEVNTCKIK